MPKHAISEEKGDFWKKVRYGATAAVALGTGVYAITTSIKNQGFVSNLFDEVKTAVHSTSPQLTVDPPNKLQANTANQPNAFPARTLRDNDEEACAVLKTQLDFAIGRGDTQRVKEITMHLDQLQGQHIKASTQTRMPSASTLQAQDQMALPTTTRLDRHSQACEDPASMGTNIFDGMAPNLSMPTITPTAPCSLSRLNRQQQVPPPMVETNGMQGPEMQTTQVSHHSSPGGNACVRPRKVAKVMDPARHAAMLELKSGDHIEALDPVSASGAWSPGVIHAINRNGLVEVRWKNPGADTNGHPFHPIGEVWAEQIRLTRRPSSLSASPIVARTQSEERLELIELPHGLEVGDICYAVGQLVEKKWFQAKLLGTRSRSPELRIEYIATIDGQSNELVLPAPRKDYVSADQVRRNKPDEPAESSLVRRSAPKEAAEGDTQKEDTKDETENNEDPLVIPPDLMCSICNLPEDESNMLVCDCMRGFHIYCLSPALEAVPEGDWKCPECSSSN